MTPEAHDILNSLYNALGKKGKDKAERSRQEGVEAFQKSDPQAATRAAENLRKSQEFPPKLAEKIQEVQRLLEEHGLSRAVITLADLGFKSDVTRVQIDEAIANKINKERTPRGIIYKENATELAALQLILKNDKGEYAHKRKVAVGREILLNNFKGDKRAEDAAQRKVDYTKYLVSNDLIEQSNKFQIDKIGLLMVKLSAETQEGGKSKFGNMKDFYNYAFDNYHNLTVPEFIENVLNRFDRKKRMTKNEQPPSVGKKK